MNSGDSFIPVKYNHLFVIISDPLVNRERIVMVNCTTHDGEEEEACVLNVGDHPFIKNKTVIRYREGRIASQADLERLIKKNLLNPNRPFSLEVLTRIRQGAANTEKLPIECRQILINQGFI